MISQPRSRRYFKLKYAVGNASLESRLIQTAHGLRKYHGNITLVRIIVDLYHIELACCQTCREGCQHERAVCERILQVFDGTLSDVRPAFPWQRAARKLRRSINSMFHSVVFECLRLAAALEEGDILIMDDKGPRLCGRRLQC